MDAIGDDYGHIREQFIGLLSSVQISRGLATHVKIVLQIKEVQEFLAERSFITN
jgi:hypothetical protein